MKHIVEFWGDYGCFTNPVYKVERVSYPVITPSAALGMLKSIYWKPEAPDYIIKKIEILGEYGSYMTYQTNEIKKVLDTSSYKTNKILIENHHIQRKNAILRDLRYRIHFELMYDPDNVGNWAKHDNCFKDKAMTGSYHRRPFMGTSDFLCDYRYVENEITDPPKIPNKYVNKTIESDCFVIHSLVFKNDILDRYMYKPVIKDGVINVPPITDKSVIKIIMTKSVLEDKCSNDEDIE